MATGIIYTGVGKGLRLVTGSEFGGEARNLTRVKPSSSQSDFSGGYCG